MQEWRTYHQVYGFNVIPVGHSIIPQLLIDAETFPDARQRLATILNCPEGGVVSALRSYLKTPTFSETLRKFIADLQGYKQVAGKGSKIPSLASVTNLRTANSKNSYQLFYEQRIDDETAERLIEVYAPLASGIAVLLGQVSNLMALDFDSTETLIRFLQDMGFQASEENLDEVLQIAFPDNLVVRTYRGYHIWSAYDAEIVKILGGKSYEEKVGGYEGFEIRCHHSYVVVPPSVCGVVNGIIRRYEFVRPHDASNRNALLPAWFYLWLKDAYKPQTQTQTQVVLSFNPPPSSVKEVVIKSLTPYWQRGRRQRLCYSLSGVMRRAALPLSEAREIIQTICELTSDEQISDRLYTVEYEYRLPLLGKQRCAGVTAFRQEALTAGVPEETIQTIIRALFGVRMTTDFDVYLQDHDALGRKIAALLRSDFCYSMRYNAWFRFDTEKLEWVKVDDKEITVYVYEAARQVRDEIAEIVKMHHSGTIPTKLIGKLNRLLDQSFVRKTIEGVARSELKVEHEFPYIPEEYIPEEFRHLKLHSTTFHRNGCLLWFDEGETYFIPNTDTFITQKEFYSTHTLPSEVREDADISTFVNFVSQVMGGKENAEYFLKIISTVVAKRENIYNKALILTGDGQNGKNSTLDILKAALGNLVQETNSAAITKAAVKGSDNNSTNAVYKLKGCAIGYIDETPDKHWDIDAFKKVTGSRTIVARQLFHNFEDIPITFILVVLTNHLPKEFDRQSGGLEERLVVIKFPYKFVDVPFENQHLKKRNPELVKQLMFNTSATIQALRHYYKLAARENFRHELPTDIYEETKKLRVKANTIKYFIQDCVIDDPASYVYVKDMYALYKEWCKHNEVKHVDDREFRERLSLTNFKLERTGRGYICHCVRLKTDFLNKDDEPQTTPLPSLLSSDNDSNNNGNESEPTPSSLSSDNGSNNNEVYAAVADNDGQDYLDEFPF
jgi:P4 family phage/plasmid primase-like protien